MTTKRMIRLSDHSSFEDALAHVSHRLEIVLKDAIPPAVGLEGRLMEGMAYVLLAGGKRLRPFFVMAGNHLFSDDEAQALRVAAAVEMIHCYSLVHDDLPAMDDDDLRRGRASCHRHYDEATAILVGDALQSLAFAVLADERTHEDGNRRLRLIAELAARAGARGMVGGQMFDLAAEGRELSYGDIAQLQRMKTGDLLTFSIIAGAILNDAKKEEQDALENYAHGIGLAFQIKDDLLDVSGSDNQLGKTAGKDKASGKATFVDHLGVKQAEQKADQLIEDAIQNLSIFGTKAFFLKEAAHFIIRRHA